MKSYWQKISIHHKKIHVLAMKMVKVYTKTSPEIMKFFFQIKDQGYYFLKNERNFVIPTVKSASYGLESIWVLTYIKTL